VLRKHQDTPDDLEHLSEKTVDAFFHVHKNLGSGYPDKVYESALCLELNRRSLSFEKQKIIKIFYPPNIILDPEYRPDLVVEGKIIVELKCVETVLPVHQAQLYSYMKMMGLPLGFLVNFNVSLITDGIRRQHMK
jgi:GxxExxY protein